MTTGKPIKEVLLDDIQKIFDVEWTIINNRNDDKLREMLNYYRVKTTDDETPWFYCCQLAENIFDIFRSLGIFRD